MNSETPIPYDPQEIKQTLSSDFFTVLDLHHEWTEAVDDLAKRLREDPDADRREFWQGDRFTALSTFLMKAARSHGMEGAALAVKSFSRAYHAFRLAETPGPNAEALLQAIEGARNGIALLMEYGMEQAESGQADTDTGQADSDIPPNLPPRLKDLYEFLQDGPRTAREIERTLGEQPAKIVNDYSKDKRWSDWTQTHIKRTDRGIYERSK